LLRSLAERGLETTPTTTRPSSEIDLYSDEVLSDPYDSYRALRDAGPVVYVEPNDVWAISRFSGVREVLRYWDRFSSASAVTLNEASNRAFTGTVLASDPPHHTKLRSVLTNQLSLSAIRTLTDKIEQQADELVAALVDRREFDAVKDLAAVFPVSVVADLIGLPQEGREKLLVWGNATFNVFGPEGNERTASAMPAVAEMFTYMAEVATRDRLTPGSMGMSVYEAADRGEIDAESCIPLLAAYVAAGMDTTVNAIGSAVLLLASNLGQWRILKSSPELIRSAANEVLRYESPVQAFARVSTDDQIVDRGAIPAGARVLVMFGSANRDDRKWENAHEFDVTRNPIDHVGFGYGIHRCAGAALAMLEIEAILTSLTKRATGIEIVGEPLRTLNNAVRGLHSLPVAVTT
jgi:cytochrome P450